MRRRGRCGAGGDVAPQRPESRPGRVVLLRRYAKTPQRHNAPLLYCDNCGAPAPSIAPRPSQAARQGTLLPLWRCGATSPQIAARGGAAPPYVNCTTPQRSPWYCETVGQPPLPLSHPPGRPRKLRYWHCGTATPQSHKSRRRAPASQCHNTRLPQHSPVALGHCGDKVRGLSFVGKACM